MAAPSVDGYGAPLAPVAAPSVDDYGAPQAPVLTTVAPAIVDPPATYSYHYPSSYYG